MRGLGVKGFMGIGFRVASASDLRRDPEAQIVVSVSFAIIPMYI